MTNQIALLGTGLMGYPMARNIAKAGFSLTVWNRTASKAAGLRNDGVQISATPTDAVADAGIVISMLSDGDAVTQMVANCAGSLRNGGLWIDMSSTQPGQARDVATALSDAGVAFLDAPVSGGSRGAADGTLAIMVGGDASAFQRAKPVFDAMGRATLVGPTGAGQLAKLANQSIVAVTIAAVAEATLLLEQGGADAGAVRAALKGGFADSIILQQHGERMSKRDFVPGGLSRLQLKDLDNVLREAGPLELPVVTHVRERFANYINDLDGGERDHSGLFQELLKRNGLPES